MRTATSCESPFTARGRVARTARDGASRAASPARRVPGVEARAGKFPGPSLIPALNAIQARLGWLPREELEELSRDARRPLYEIEGLISFYPHFRTEPPAKVALHVCHDLPCFLRDGDARLAELRERYGEDADVELVEVSCLGRCDIAPAVAVNERPAPVEDADALVAAARRRRGRAPRPANERTEPWPNDPYPAGSGVAERYATLRALLAGELDPDTIVHTLKDSGLRGMGGAGFPTGQKWELVRDTQPGGRQVRHLQRRRVRAGHLQGPPDPGHPAAPGAGGPAARHGGGGRRAGLGVHPARVRPGGARAARRAGRAARGRRRSGRTPAAAGGGSTSRCSSRPAATSSARRPRCWSAWRATAASRATSRRSPATTACTAGRR